MVCKPLFCTCGNYVFQQRYVLSIMLCSMILVTYSMRLCLNIALTKIVVPKEAGKDVIEEVCPGNNTEILQGGTYNWSEKDQGIILLSFFPGYIITHLPGGVLADKIGGKYIISGCVAVSIICTILTPVVIMHLNFLSLVFIRVILGIAQGPSFPATASLLAAWIPRKERSTLVGLVYSGVFLGSITGNFLSGVLMAYTKSWPIVFYIWAAIAVVWIVLFHLYCYSRPELHPFITQEEADYLQAEIGPVRRFKIPWVPILTDPAVIAITFMQAGHDWITYTFVTDLPKFFHDVLKFTVGEVGTILGISFAIMWAFSIILGWVADFIVNREIVSLLGMRKWYGAISNAGPTLVSVLATYMGCNKTLVVGWLWIGMVFKGFWFPGPKVNTLDITLNFTGIIMAISNGFGVISGIIVPYCIALVAPDGTLKQWRTVFWISFVVSGTTAIPFLLWAAGKRRKWDYVEESAE